VNRKLCEKPKSLNDRVSLGGLMVLLVLSEIIYLLLLQLDAVNGWTPVLTFWLEMGALFAFYGTGVWVVKRTEKFKKSMLFLIIFGTILFRITLLPAGLPFDANASEKFAALQTDLNGQEVTYERFQLFDNDIWRYLWDGHIWANGVNPFKYAPAAAELDKFSGDAAVPEEEILPEEFSGDESVEQVSITETAGNEAVVASEIPPQKKLDEVNPR